MVWSAGPPSPRRLPREGEQEGGFTLIEMLVVLVIAGLMVGLVISRGPMRSTALELRAAASGVAQTLRVARGKAILGNREVSFALDTAAHSYRIVGAPPKFLPPAIALTAVVSASDAARNRIAGIEFLPDGSSSGGGIALAEAGRKTIVNVDWLTGRVSIADAK